MSKEKEHAWSSLPILALPSPVFALAIQQDLLWAGGVGGIASWSLTSQQGEWVPSEGALPLSSVSTMLAVDSLLLLGGSEGIAYSFNRGASWQRAALEDGFASITALVASPQFSHDSIALAATMDNGILRTNDGGRTWKNASFGLECLEVTALTWEEGGTLLAATRDGIYRSRDAGRAWRRVSAEEDLEIEALLLLPDKTLLAASSSQGLLRSSDGGRSWSADARYADAQALSLFRTASGTLLLSTLEHGLLRSTDGGENWSTVDILIVNTYQSQACLTLFAGTNRGISRSSDDGLTWSELPPPPTHDLQTLLRSNEQLLVSGRYSGIIHITSRGWESLPDIPQPLTASLSTPGSTILLSSPDGLQEYFLQDQTRKTLLNGELGYFIHITSRQEETGLHIWAVSADGKRLLQSQDSGANWQTSPTPFGILPLVTLQVISDRLLAATYDPRQYRVQIWHSTNDGNTWTQSLEASTDWPIVATCAYPPTLSIGNILFLERSPDSWQQTSLPEGSGAIRRITSVQLETDLALCVLTTTGILRSDNMGENWYQQDINVTGEQIIDITGSQRTLTALLRGGRVWQTDLQ